MPLSLMILFEPLWNIFKSVPSPNWISILSPRAIFVLSKRTLPEAFGNTIDLSAVGSVTLIAVSKVSSVVPSKIIWVSKVFPNYNPETSVTSLLNSILNSSSVLSGSTCVDNSAIIVYSLLICLKDF